MSTFRNPVGPQSPRVYWRRRLVVGLGLLAVIIVIVLLFVRPGAGGDDPRPGQTPTDTTASPAPSGSGEPTDPADASACNPEKITVEGVVSARTFEAGEVPMLSLSVKSTATEACTIQAGSDVQEFRITSGDELIWSSSHCQTAPEGRLQLLKPGIPVSTTPIPWDRTRSSPDTCDAEREPVTADGASYHLTVVVGDHESANDTQFLLY